MHTGTVSIDTLVPAPSSSSPQPYPDQKVGYGTCWKTIGLTGQYNTDYDALIAACGTPTGMVRYTAPLTGVLDQTHKQDTYKVKLYGGLCYRALGAGDSTLSDLDIRIQKLDGALIADEMGRQPIAIVDDVKAWCQKSDEDVDFLLVVDGPGNGRYEFGIWAAPKH